MKKLSILFIGLLLVTGFAFAQDVSVSGEASVTWGVDLNTSNTGFQNDATFTLEILWADEVDYENMGEDDIYGSILIEEASLGLDNTDGTGTITVGGSVTAMIVISPLEITIYSAPAFSFDYAEVIDIDEDTPNIETDISGTNTIGGITISIPVDPITVDVKVASDGDWTDNASNEYIIGSDIELDVDPATVTLGFAYGWFGAPELGLSAEVDLSLADVVEGLDLTVAFDGNMPDGGDFGFDVGSSIVVGLTPDNDDDDSADLSLGVYFAPFAAGTDNDLDLTIGFTEPGDGGLADMLAFGVDVLLADLLVDLGWYVDVTGSYDTGDVKPYFGFGLGSDDVIDLNLGVELYEGLTGIDLTTIVIDYEATDLTGADIGVVTISATVEY